MPARTTPARAVAIATLATVLLGCQAQFQDLDTEFYSDPREIRQEFPVLVTNPDSLTIYRNADGFPNVALICIRGVPFTATSSTHQGGLRQVLDIDGRQGVADLCEDQGIDADDVPVGSPGDS